MTPDQLIAFIEEKMSMQHVYQPLLIKVLVESGGSATVRQLAQRLGGYSGLAMVGTPKTIADEMEEWLMTEASDGFTIMFPNLPAGLDDEESETLNRQINAGLEGIRSENHSLMIKLVAQLVLAKVQLFQHARD